MDLAAKASHLRDAAKTRMLESRAEGLGLEKQRLTTENRVLREELGELRTEREKLLEALDRLGARPEETSAPKARKGRVRRLFTLSAAAAGAYVLGAKAGRERYDQIRSWWMDRTGSAGVDQWAQQAREHAAEAAHRTSDRIEEAAQRVSDRIDDTAEQL